MKISSLREMSVEKLSEELIALRREFFNLRMKRSSGEQIKSHQFSKTKRNIARILTLLTEMKLLGKKE